MGTPSPIRPISCLPFHSFVKSPGLQGFGDLTLYMTFGGRLMVRWTAHVYGGPKRIVADDMSDVRMEIGNKCKNNEARFSHKLQLLICSICHFKI